MRASTRSPSRWTSLDPTVVAVHLHMVVVLNSLEVLQDQLVNQQLDLPVQRRLVLLHLQDIVRLAAQDHHDHDHRH